MQKGKRASESKTEGEGGEERKRAKSKGEGGGDREREQNRGRVREENYCNAFQARKVFFVLFLQYSGKPLKKCPPHDWTVNSTTCCC